MLTLPLLWALTPRPPLLLIVTLTRLINEPLPTLMPSPLLFVITLGAPTNPSALCCPMTTAPFGLVEFSTVTPSSTTPEATRPRNCGDPLKLNVSDLNVSCRELLMLKPLTVAPPLPWIVSRLKPAMLTASAVQALLTVMRLGPLRSAIDARAVLIFPAAPG